MLNKLFSVFILLFIRDIHSEEDFRQFLSQYVPLRDGKIFIPEHIQHIKLDIGLSYSAPMSQYWLSREENLLVFGFEPNPTSVLQILKGAKKQHPFHGEPLDVKFIDSSFFLIPCALGLAHNKMVPFYVTKDDCGCSSVYEPNYLEVASVINVPFFKLSDFFDLFPFDEYPIIEYIKIDAQGSDLNIIKSAGTYLKDHVLFITLEADCSYKNSSNSESEIEKYMNEMNFFRYHSKDVSDPTFLNSKFKKYVKTHPVKIYQNG
jgi:hypothetical protein